MTVPIIRRDRSNVNASSALAVGPRRRKQIGGKRSLCMLINSWPFLDHDCAFQFYCLSGKESRNDCLVRNGHTVNWASS